ncbi:MAG: TIGR03936 family radical SAM-associated protein [Bacillota bacterium]
MPRLKIEFAKEGLARFISHLELMKTWERALRRAAVPVAYSEGFNPHPRMSFALPLAVGSEGLREYLEIMVEAGKDLGAMTEALSKALPAGLRVISVTLLPDGGPPLMAQVEGASYLVRSPLSRPISEEELKKALDAFSALSEAVVMKEGKHGPKPQDVRPGVYCLQAELKGSWVELQMSLKAGSQGNVRPEDVVKALMQYTGLPLIGEGLKIIRRDLLAKGPDGFVALGDNQGAI